ncbi:hypothetical protein LJC56_01325 [Christensenellaceae bacterium OttesenSCG-928-K19]|nr:hypothetical protein [Christensenellaceae bacterium OttesenSCG-928-K19]
MNITPHRSSIGMNANLWALLLYLITLGLGWVPTLYYFAWIFPLIFFLTETSSSFVRYHAMQATSIFIFNAIARAVCDIISFAVAFSSLSSLFSAFYVQAPAAPAIIGIVLTGIFDIFAILFMIKAYQYQWYQMPVFSALAFKLASIGHTNPQKSPFEPKPQPQYQPPQGQPYAPQQPPATWQCTCGAVGTGNFCVTCGKQKPPQNQSYAQQSYPPPQGQAPGYQPQQAYPPPQEQEPNNQPQQGQATDVWQCICGAENNGNFCIVCGKQKQDGLTPQ